MAAQLSYKFQPPIGIAGSLVDLAPHAINSRTNAEATPGALKFGMGAVMGDNPGVNVAVPTSTSTLGEFEGVVMTGFTNEMDMAGAVNIKPLQTVGVLRWGRAWVRVEDGAAIAYGDPVFLITNGNNAGLFTNIATGNVAVNAMFIGGLGTTSIAPIELYNQKNEAATVTAP